MKLKSGSFLPTKRAFAAMLGSSLALDDKWTARGFIEIFKIIHPISLDTKIALKVLELHSSRADSWDDH
ncbi:MAG: EcoRV family type II restriction endonuclease [Clostridiales bacterium]|nr:EcoRV family type II restriction endonuclease [Clostridiales bacterium]